MTVQEYLVEFVRIKMAIEQANKRAQHFWVSTYQDCLEIEDKEEQAALWKILEEYKGLGEQKCK